MSQEILDRESRNIGPSTCAANSFVIDQPVGNGESGFLRARGARVCRIFIEWHVSICMYIGWEGKLAAHRSLLWFQVAARNRDLGVGILESWG